MYNVESRVKSSMKNTFFSAFGQIIKEIMAFVVRTVFIRTLAVEYVGVNGLFTNVLSFLSLAEMGIGSAIIFSMYKPMAEHDETKLQMYMQLYKKVYSLIGISIITIGVCLTPFLDFFINERPDIPYLEFIYILYVLNTSATYFFAYKGSIFNADQRAYVVTNNNTLFTVIQSVLRIVILLLTHNFIMYLVVSIVIVYIQNFVLAHTANKQYPFICEKSEKKLPKEELKVLKKNIGALMMHKVGSVVLNSSDNLIISKFVGLVSVGVYSNYSLITNAVKTIFNLIMSSVTPSVGNLCSKESKEKVQEVHDAILLINVWLIAFCSISLYYLLNPFITIWVGNVYLLDNVTIFALVISFYIQCTMRTNEMFKTGSGLFWNDRYAPLLQCLINIIISIVMSIKFGIAGIFIGTSIAMLCTKFWVGPYILYKYKFEKPVYLYFVKYGKYTLIGVIAGILTHISTTLISDNGIISFIAKILGCCIVPNIVFLLLTFRTKEFLYCRKLILRR